MPKNRFKQTEVSNVWEQVKHQKHELKHMILYIITRYYWIFYAKSCDVTVHTAKMLTDVDYFNAAKIDERMYDKELYKELGLEVPLVRQ